MDQIALKIIEQINPGQLILIGFMFLWFYTEIERKFEGVDKKFEGVDKKFDQVGERFERMEKSINELDKRLVRIETMLHTQDCCVLRAEHREKAE